MHEFFVHNISNLLWQYEPERGRHSRINVCRQQGMIVFFHRMPLILFTSNSIMLHAVDLLYWFCSYSLYSLAADTNGRRWCSQAINHTLWTPRRYGPPTSHVPYNDNRPIDCNRLLLPFTNLFIYYVRVPAGNDMECEKSPAIGGDLEIMTNSQLCVVVMPEHNIYSASSKDYTIHEH